MSYTTHTIASITIQLELGYVLILPLWIAGIGVLTGRVLGIQIGRLRGGVAAAVGWVVGAVAGAIALGPKHSHPVLVVSLVAFFGVLAAMPVAIVLELIRPDRRRPRRRRGFLRHPARAAKSVLAPLGRFWELVGIARAENLLHVRYRTAAALASPDLARRVRTVLERAGGMFVKFGQIAATRSDLLPETLTGELSNLHSNVARVPPEQVTDALTTELGEPVERAFASFDLEPLAAASIGQTHRAILHDGRAVIVKVQRPGLDEIVRRDSAVLSFVARQLDQRVDSAHRVGVRELADELIRSIETELDYSREVAAGGRLLENLDAVMGIRIPAVYPTLSTDRMLVMDEVVGRSISDTAAVDAAPVDRPELARRLLSSLLNQILNDGYYHADPHPGNIFIDAQGTLWLLDFGAVGRIDPVVREALQGIGIAFSLRDGSLLARAVRYLVGDEMLDMRQLERDLSVLIGDVDVGGLGPEALTGVMEVMDSHGLRPPPSMLLLSRTLLTLEGTLRTIDPHFDFASQAERFVSHERGDMGGPEDLLRKELVRALPALRTLPEHTEAIAGQLRSGRLVMRTERYAGSDRTIVEDWFNRALVAAAGAATAVGSAGVLVAGSLSPDKGVRDALWILGIIGLTGAAVLLLRTVAQALRGGAEQR